PGRPALGAVSGVPPAAGPQMVLPQSFLSTPHLHRASAHRGGPLGAPYPAAGPAPSRPRRGVGRQSRGAPRPRVGGGRQPAHAPAPAAPPAGASRAYPPRAGGGRLGAAERPHLRHDP